jgi:ligand-binding sensor domain-containing protein/signal transduction histidine kinase
LKKIFLLLYLLTTAVCLYAQPYYFKHYQVENGLSNNTVFCSVQDNKGFMWFGTKDGLNRFDGYTFKTYRHDPATRKSIGNDLIYSLHSDHKARLWIGTNKGIHQYHPVNDSFSVLNYTAKMSIHQVESDQQGNLWFIADSRLYRYNLQKNSLYAFKDKAAFDANTIYIAADHSIWICTTKGTIEKYDPVSGKFSSHYVLNRNEGGYLGVIAGIRETADGKMIIGTNTQGIKLYDPKSRILKDLITLNKDKTHIFVRNLIKQGADKFWAGTESGIYIYDHHTGKITHLSKQYDNWYTLSDNAIYSLCRDREGGIWACTYFGGVNYYSGQHSIFSKYFPMQSANSISGSAVREIKKDFKGNIWIGTEDAGLNKFDPVTGRFSSFLPDGSKNSIAYSNIHGLLVQGNRLWVSTFEHGIDLIDIASGKVVKHYADIANSGLRSNFIITFYKTATGDIIVATTYGLYTYNNKTDHFDAVPGLPFTFYNTLTEDHEGNIWAGTFNEGIYLYHPGQPGYKHLQYNSSSDHSLANNTVNGIFEDSRKDIWVTTDGGGLCLYNRSNSTFRRYTTKNGLPSNVVFRIEEDDDHMLWISSTRGLIHFNPLTGGSKTYTRADGLLTDQFNYSSSFKDSSGRMYFGSVKGMISFEPHQFRTKSYTAPVFLTNFHIDNEEGDERQDEFPNDRSVVYTDTIILNSNQSSFSINFAALSYFSPEMTKYAYKMSGLYKGWEYLKTNRKVYFTKLAPGNYVFEAKAMINGSNDWSQQNVKILIRIYPPFYQSTAAIIGYLLLFLLVCAYLIKRYKNRLARKEKRRMEVFEHEKEKEVYQAKIEFFTHVSHEIRTPLTLIKGPMEKLIGQAHEVPAMEKNLKIMNRNTDRLLNLTNQLLDFRKTEINGFSLNFIKANISEMLREITLDFQTIAEQKNITINIEVPESALFAYVDTEALHKMVSSLVDNAVKYGRKKLIVTLNTEPENADYFQIRIMSDGKLIPPILFEKVFEPFYRLKETEIRPGTGIGLSISRSLAELHQGSLIIERNHLDLNIFVITLPVHQLIEFNLNEKWKKH